MRTIHILVILVLLALALPASPAHASGVVTVCDEPHLLAALAGGGTVTFACSGTITLTATITIAADTTIDGSGQAVTISGNHAVGVFIVYPGKTLYLNRLTIANGNAAGGGGIDNSGTLTVSYCTFSDNRTSYDGGGIYNTGIVTVSNSTFSDNHTPGSCDPYCLYEGGAIANEYGTVTVNNSTFSGNSAHTGGAIYNYYGTVTVSNSIFSGNSAEQGGSGGGIFNLGATVNVSNNTFSGNRAAYGGGIENHGTVTVSNSTFADNSAAFAGGGVYNHGTLTVSNSTFSGNSATYSGGGISNYDAVTLKNTIVANSLAGSNCSGAIGNGGGNLSYPDTTCPGINADPVLGPLQNNGGPTYTMALGPGSAAIDAADDAICAAPPVNNLDQRGVTRPQGPHCDIGAVEQILEPAAVSISALSAQSLPGTITPAMVAALLLAALVGVGVRRRHRHMI